MAGDADFEASLAVAFTNDKVSAGDVMRPVVRSRRAGLSQVIRLQLQEASEMKSTKFLSALG